MAAQVTSYKCPSCTAPLHFVGETQRLDCEYCGSSFSVEEIEQLYAEKNAAAAAAEPSAAAQAQYDDQWGEGAEHMRAYSCPSCAAELICDDTTAATSCPYCGNPTIVPGQFSGVKRPDYVIPFRLSKQEAIAALKQHCKGKLLLPKAFTAEHHVQEIKGVYVPFWLFDGEADGSAHFSATRSFSTWRGDDEVITTKHYDVYREGTVRFERVPVDASTKMPDAYMDAIEPYDYEELRPFAMAYLPGYLADKFDVTADESLRRAAERMKNSTVDVLRDSVDGYHTCIMSGNDVSLDNVKSGYALMPVWMLSTQWHGKNYLFAVNGQTGKVVGELPVSWGRFGAWFAGIAGGLAAIVLAIMLGGM